MFQKSIYLDITILKCNILYLNTVTQCIYKIESKRYALYIIAYNSCWTRNKKNMYVVKYPPIYIQYFLRLVINSTIFCRIYLDPDFNNTIYYNIGAYIRSIWKFRWSFKISQPFRHYLVRTSRYYYTGRHTFSVYFFFLNS